MNVEQSFPVEARTENSHAAISTWIKKRRWFVIVVILPTILAAFYYGLIASDVYISESRFVITSPEEKRPQLSTLANLIQTTGLSGGQEQAREVLEFVKSRDALRSLERTGIKAKFGSEDADFISRYPQPFAQGTFEDLYKYYGKMVKARLDNESGTAILEVQAFTARDAYEINRDLLSLSEGLVNRLNERARTTGIAEAQKQVNLALERARKARSALAEYRNSQALIDPTKQAVGVLEIADKMIAERAALQAQLELMQRMTPDNPSIPALRSRISAISVQIASQDNRVVGSRQGIASKVGGYENLLVEQEFATESLNVANAALVQARAAAQRQQFYLEHIVEPNMPDMPLLPRRLLDIIIVAAIATCLYFIGWMFIVGILEHAPED
jgi:capsular polysaccharide transport system permease protein